MDDELAPVPPAPEPPRRPSYALAAISWARDLFVSVLIAVVIILFLYQPVKVEGTSMMPALQDQERIFINKFVYTLGIGKVGRGDTVGSLEVGKRADFLALQISNYREWPYHFGVNMVQDVYQSGRRIKVMPLLPA